MGVFQIGEVRCPKCGKRFLQRHIGQQYCYEPCVPHKLKWEYVDKEKVKRDCIMCRTDGIKEWCSGLDGLYCGYGDCKFYKQKEKKK